MTRKEEIIRDINASEGRLEADNVAIAEELEVMFQAGDGDGVADIYRAYLAWNERGISGKERVSVGRIAMENFDVFGGVLDATDGKPLDIMGLPNALMLAASQDREPGRRSEFIRQAIGWKQGRK